MMPEKERLDIVLYERGLAPSRAKARAMVMAREVLLNGQIVSKPGTRVMPDAELSVRARPPYVSRGGEKLAAALKGFGIHVSGRVCADVGASTGGFTDCLLQHEAARVYAIDVGYGLLDYALRQNVRVVVMERTNARYVEKLPEPIDLVVVDASFISLRLLLPAIKGWLSPRADVVALVKPQFEAGRRDVGKGGVVRNRLVHERVLSEVLLFAQQQGFTVRGLITSPLKGPAGNIEFLAWLGWGCADAPALDVASLIAGVVGDSAT